MTEATFSAFATLSVLWWLNHNIYYNVGIKTPHEECRSEKRGRCPAQKREHHHPPPLAM